MCCKDEREAAAATPSLDALAAALYNRDYPRATESHADWFAATGDRQYVEEAEVVCGYLNFPATMRPEWATSWVRAARLDEGSATPEDADA